MIKITSTNLESIMLKNFNKDVSYIGILADKMSRVIKPTKFAFLEWDIENKMKSFVTIQETHLLKLIQSDEKK